MQDIISNISRVLKKSLPLFSIFFIITYLFVVFSRINYPFNLEWVEGLAVDHIKMILDGGRMYVPPSLEFIPFNYTPLYFYVSAFLSKITGVSFLPVRLLSFFSSLGCFYVIFLIVNKETERPFYGFVSAGLFAATFAASGSWFDLARPDSFYLFLILASAYYVKFGRSVTASFAAGILISLAFLTKQSAIVIAAPLALYYVFVNWRHAVVFSFTAFAVIGGSILLIDHLHDGWFSYYIFELPSQYSSRLVRSRITTFWTVDILGVLPYAFGLSLFYLVSQQINFRNRNLIFYLLLSSGMVLASWLPRLQGGGYLNSLFFVYAVISILFGLGLHQLLEIVGESNANRREPLKVFILLLSFIQFIILLYNPFNHIPDKRDLEAGSHFIKTISEIEGEVFIPSQSSLPSLAGKRSFAHPWSTYDMLGWGREDLKQSLSDEIENSIKEQRFGAVILNDDVVEWLPDNFDYYYVNSGTVFQEKDVFWTITGKMTRPEYIYLPREK